MICEYTVAHNNRLIEKNRRFVYLTIVSKQPNQHVSIIGDDDSSLFCNYL